MIGGMPMLEGMDNGALLELVQQAQQQSRHMAVATLIFTVSAVGGHLFFLWLISNRIQDLIDLLRWQSRPRSDD